MRDRVLESVVDGRRPIWDLLPDEIRGTISRSGQKRGMFLRGYLTLTACCRLLGFGNPSTSFGSVLQKAGVRTETGGESGRGKCSTYYYGMDVLRLSAILGGPPPDGKTPGFKAIYAAGERLVAERDDLPQNGTLPRVTRPPVSRADQDARIRRIAEEKARHHSARIDAIRRAAEENRARAAAEQHTADATPPPEAVPPVQEAAGVPSEEGGRAGRRQFKNLLSAGFANTKTIRSLVPGAPTRDTAVSILRGAGVRYTIVPSSNGRPRKYYMWSVEEAVPALKEAVRERVGRRFPQASPGPQAPPAQEVKVFSGVTEDLSSRVSALEAEISDLRPLVHALRMLSRFVQGGDR